MRLLAARSAAARMKQRWITLPYFLNHYKYGRHIKWSVGSVAAFTGLYYLDQEFYARTFQRNFRTIWNGICLTLDYKLNFQPGKDIEAVHQRSAERILKVCQQNGYVLPLIIHHSST